MPPLDSSGSTLDCEVVVAWKVMPKTERDPLTKNLTKQLSKERTNGHKEKKREKNERNKGTKTRRGEDNGGHTSFPRGTHEKVEMNHKGFRPSL